MHQSFETPLPGPGGEIHSVWVWKPVKFPDTGAKILRKVHAPWYSAVQTKVPSVESAVTAFLKSSQQTLKSISKEENVNTSYANNLCQMFKLPKMAQKCEHWQIFKCESPLICEEVSLIQMARSRLLTPSGQTTLSRLKVRLQRSESECSQAGEYEVIIPPGWGAGVSNDWCTS